MRALRLLCPLLLCTLALHAQEFVPPVREGVSWYTPDVLFASHARIGIGLLVVLITYLLYAGLVIGTRRRFGNVTVRSTPPNGLSPTQVRLLWIRGVDHKTLATTLVSLATRGALTLVQEKEFTCVQASGAPGLPGELLSLLRVGTSYTLAELANTLDVAPKHIREGLARLREVGYGIATEDARIQLLSTNQPDTPAMLLSPEEHEVAAILFADQDRLTLDGPHNVYVHGAEKALKNCCRQQFEGQFYINRASVLHIGIVLGIVVSLACGFIGMTTGIGSYMIGALPLLAGFLFLIGRVIPQAGILLSGKGHRPGYMGFWMVIGTAILCLFMGIGIYMLGYLPVLFLAALTLTMWGNYWLMWRLRLPTPEGQQLLDQCEGFRRRLVLTPNEVRMQAQGPTLSPRLFDEWLPYAMALDAEDAWARQCASLYPKQAELPWFASRPATLPTLAGRLGTALPYAIDLVFHAGNRGTSVPAEDIDSDDDQEPARTR